MCGCRHELCSLTVVFTTELGLFLMQSLNITNNQCWFLVLSSEISLKSTNSL